MFFFCSGRRSRVNVVNQNGGQSGRWPIGTVANRDGGQSGRWPIGTVANRDGGQSGRGPIGTVVNRDRGQNYRDQSGRWSIKAWSISTWSIATWSIATWPIATWSIGAVVNINVTKRVPPVTGLWRENEGSRVRIPVGSVNFSMPYNMVIMNQCRLNHYLLPHEK